MERRGDPELTLYDAAVECAIGHELSRTSSADRREIRIRGFCPDLDQERELELRIYAVAGFAESGDVDQLGASIRTENDRLVSDLLVPTTIMDEMFALAAANTRLDAKLWVGLGDRGLRRRIASFTLVRDFPCDGDHDRKGDG